MLKLENHQVLGSKGILIKLLPFSEEVTVNEFGMLKPLFEAYETDGGRPGSKLREEDFSTVGEILQISSKAEQLLKEEEMDVKIGDYISIYQSYKHPSNQFLVNKDIPNQEFEGYLTIHPTMIQSKIINYNHG